MNLYEDQFYLRQCGYFFLNNHYILFDLQDDTVRDESSPKKLAVERSSTSDLIEATPHTVLLETGSSQSASTHASHNELSKPFRSPVLSKKSSSSSATFRIPENPSRINKASFPPFSSSQVSSASVSSSLSQSSRTSLIRANIKAASKPFKSPLLSKKSSTSTISAGGIDEKRMIQTLEKKVLTLKQARKYRLDGCVHLFAMRRD